jgi:hypothetical protein
MTPAVSQDFQRVVKPIGSDMDSEHENGAVTKMKLRLRSIFRILANVGSKGPSPTGTSAVKVQGRRRGVSQERGSARAETA